MKGFGNQWWDVAGPGEMEKEAGEGRRRLKRQIARAAGFGVVWALQVTGSHWWVLSLGLMWSLVHIWL